MFWVLPIGVVSFSYTNQNRKMYNLYNINDLVKYQGNLDIFSNNFAKIIDLPNPNDIQTVRLLSLNNNQTFKSYFNEIRHVLLEEKHLINLGFKKCETQGNLTKFALNNIIVSSRLISVIDENADARLFQSGFILGDLTVTIDFKHYLSEKIIDSEKFHKDFPRMYTLNNLLDYLKKNNIKFDEVEVSTL